MTDYTINGVTYTEDTLKAEAEKRGYDFETYKSKLEKKHGENFQYDPATAETNVGSKTNMVSNSDPGSSDLPKIPTRIGDELQGLSIDDIPRKTPNNGELVFGDPRNLKTQISDYRKDYIDAFNGKGRFAEILIDKNPKERLELIERLIPKPKYIDKKYNKLTDSYDEQPSKGAVETFSSYLPSDFDLYDKPEQFNKAMEDAKVQALNDDPVVKIMLGARMSVVKKSAEAYQKSLGEKYDLTTQGGVNKANKDYQDWFNTNVVDYIEDSTALQNISDQLEDVGNVAMSERNTEYSRNQDFMLSAFDFDKDFFSCSIKFSGVLTKQ